MSTESIVILAAKRTPIGSFQGVLSAATASQLGGAAISGALVASGLAPELVNEVIMGCVLPAGPGQAPARQAALKAGIADAGLDLLVQRGREGRAGLRRQLNGGRDGILVNAHASGASLSRVGAGRHCKRSVTIKQAGPAPLPFSLC